VAAAFIEKNSRPIERQLRLVLRAVLLPAETLRECTCRLAIIYVPGHGHNGTRRSAELYPPILVPDRRVLTSRGKRCRSQSQQPPPINVADNVIQIMRARERIELLVIERSARDQ